VNTVTKTGTRVARPVGFTPSKNDVERETAAGHAKFEREDHASDGTRHQEVVERWRYRVLGMFVYGGGFGGSGYFTAMSTLTCT
jgi:hypothetical protein